MNDLDAAALWPAIGFREYQTVEEWRKEHFPQLTREECFACEIRSIESAVVRKPFGNISVTVSVVSTRPGKSCIRYFAFTRVGNKLYKALD
jgi:hypothetical protein